MRSRDAVGDEGHRLRGVLRIGEQAVVGECGLVGAEVGDEQLALEDRDVEALGR